MLFSPVFAKLQLRPDSPSRTLLPGPIRPLRHSTPLFPTVSGLFCAMDAPQPLSFQSLADSFYRNGGCTPLTPSSSNASSPICSISCRPSHFSSTTYKTLLAQLLCFDNDPFSWGVYGGSCRSSQNPSADTRVVSNRGLNHRRSSAGPLQHTSYGASFLADVAHPKDTRRFRDPRRARHVANFFAVQRQRRPRLWHSVAGKNQLHALTVHLPARTHSLHNLLPGVAALRKADMAVLQSRLVRNLLFAEVISEPRHALRQPQRAQRHVAHRPAAKLSHRLEQNLPDLRHLISLDNKLGPGNFSRRPLHDPAGNRTHAAVAREKFSESCDVHTRNFAYDRSSLRSLQRQRRVSLGLIRQCHVVHNDEFVQHFDQPRANHRVGNAEERLRERVRLDLRQDVPLWIQQERNGALARCKVLDIVRENGIQVANSVRPGKRKIRAVVLVNERDAIPREAVFRAPAGEFIRQRASEPHAHLRARIPMQRRQRRLQSFASRGRFHAPSHPPAFSLSNSASGHAAAPPIPPDSDAIMPFMDEGLPSLTAASDGLIHITIPVGILQCNCSIIGDPITREALVVDPGDEVSRVLDLLGRHKLTVKAIVSTHAHIDHVGGLSKLHKYTGAPVMMHRDDVPLYQAMEIQAAFLGVAPPEIGELDQLLAEGDALRWGSLVAHVMHTPGHTPGSVCLYLPHEAGNLSIPAPQLFAGDTLFAGSIGRVDLWGGSMDDMMDSLKGKLMALPDETLVHPGHGPGTTIGRERESNPFLVER